MVLRSISADGSAIICLTVVCADNSLHTILALRLEQNTLDNKTSVIHK